MSLPALEYLKSDHTEVWVPSAIVPLIGFADRVRAIGSTGLDLFGVGDLKSPCTEAALRSFDHVVSWYGENRPEFRDAIAQLGIACDFHRALPPPGYPGHAVDFFSQQVGAPLGSCPQIAVRPAAPRGTVVIHPFSGSPRKNWPLDKYRQLAGSLPCKVEWIAGPEEVLAEATRFDDLKDLATWLTGAKLFIGNDSGISHLAASVGVPVLALFGPSSPLLWSPRGHRIEVLEANPLGELEVSRVLEAANRLLDSP